MMQEQQMEKTTVARPRKNVAGEVRLVSEPEPLVGPGLRLRSDMFPVAGEMISKHKDQGECLARTLIRNRAYSHLVNQVDSSAATCTNKQFFLASGLSFLAGVAVTTAVVMAVL